MPLNYCWMDDLWMTYFNNTTFFCSTLQIKKYSSLTIVPFIICNNHDHLNPNYTRWFVVVCVIFILLNLLAFCDVITNTPNIMRNISMYMICIWFSVTTMWNTNVLHLQLSYTNIYHVMMHKGGKKKTSLPWTQWNAQLLIY